MPSIIAIRPVVRWLLIAAVLGVVAHQLLDEDVEYRTCEEKLEIVESLQPSQVFFAKIQGRVEQWLADHPDKPCPPIGDLAALHELADHDWKTIELVCSDRRIVVLSATPLD